MKKSMRIVFCCLAVLSLSMAVFAEVIERSGAGGDETIDCRGRAFKLDGASNHFVLLGECPELSIEGAGNVVDVERVGTIRINGAGNKIFWGEALVGRIPDNFNEGAGNEIVQKRMKPNHAARHEKHSERHREDAGDNGRTDEDTPDAVAVDSDQTAVKVEGGAVAVETGQGSVKVKSGPRGSSVKVEGSQGSVKVKGGPRGGAVKVESAQGSVKVKGGPNGGAVKVESAQGSVKVDVGGHDPE